MRRPASPSGRVGGGLLDLPSSGDPRSAGSLGQAEPQHRGHAVEAEATHRDAGDLRRGDDRHDAQGERDHEHDQHANTFGVVADVPLKLGFVAVRWLAACAVFIALLGGCGDDDDGAAEHHVIAAVGDSITAGSPGWDPDPQLRRQLNAHDPKSQWEYWAAAELGGEYDVRNCGVPGDRTDEIAARLATCLEGADMVVLQGGVNDLVQGFPSEFAVRNMRAMIERARGAGLPVLVANLLPVNRRYPGITPKIESLNRRYGALGRAEDVDIVDFFGTLEGPPGSGRMPARWTADGVHPSIEGYQRVGRAVARTATETGAL